MSLVSSINIFTGNLRLTGLKRIYDLADIKAGVSRPDCPALLPVIATGEYGRTAYGAAETAYDDQHRVLFRFLYCPRDTKHFGEAQAALADYVHRFRVAVVTLDSEQSGVSVEPVSYEAGEVGWYGEAFYGCDFSVEFTVDD